MQLHEYQVVLVATKLRARAIYQHLEAFDFLNLCLRSSEDLACTFEFFGACTPAFSFASLLDHGGP